MADYIYLLQNRLNTNQWRALEAVREAARAQAMPVFLVGGAVRDLTSGSPVRDLDFALQGDASALLASLEDRGARLTGRNEVFGSVFLTFRGGVRVEISPTSSVRYPKPGQPEVQSAVILDDLRHRDFTANAMAVSLNEGSYGLLLDPLNGTADIENREFRLVSPYGFIEQPALLLRAARLQGRLGWSLEEKTRTRYGNSKEEDHIQALSDFDRGYELEEIFHEEDAAAIIEHMAAEGWRDTLFPALQAQDADESAVDEVRDLLGQLESQGLYPDPSAVMFPLVTAKMSEADRAALKKMFARQGFVEQVESLEARGKELAGQITSKSVAQPSDTWRLLMDGDPEVLLWLAQHSRSSAVQAKIKAFLKEWPPLRQRMPYALMQEMRITPDLPGYDKLLEDLFFALIDGKLETTEATRAFLEPYSPPAPPQVAVRRRAAKATRGRAKRVQDEAVPDRSDEDEDEDEDDEPAARSRQPGTQLDSPDDDADEAAEQDEAENEDADDDEEEESEESDDRLASPTAEAVAPAPAVPERKTTASAVKKSSAKTATAREETPAEKAVPAKAGAKTAILAKPSLAVKSASPATGIAKSAPTSTPAKDAPEKTAAKAAPSAVAKKAPATVIVVKQPVKSVTPAKGAATKQPASAARVAVKAVPAPVKAPAKAAAKQPAAKDLPGAAVRKAVPVKEAPVKTAAKAPAKGRR